MNDSAKQLQRRYRHMRMHTKILAGDSDRIVSPRHHSEVLANLLPTIDQDAAETSGHRDLVD